MEENFDALDVIARTRGKVDMDSTPTGDFLFVLWGAVTAFFYLLEFILWQAFGAEWCLWLWIGIPVVGIPVMSILIRKDRERAHMRTRRSKLVLDYWIFAACAIGLGGFFFGIMGIYAIAENPMICLLVGIGAFITGEETRFRPIIVGGLAGTVLGIASFALQGDIWVYQTLCIVAVAIVALLIPGLLYQRALRNGV